MTPQMINELMKIGKEFLKKLEKEDIELLEKFVDNEIQQIKNNIKK